MKTVNKTKKCISRVLYFMREKNIELLALLCMTQLMIRLDLENSNEGCFHSRKTEVSFESISTFLNLNIHIRHICLYTHAILSALN